MERKEFLTKGMVALGGIVAFGSMAANRKDNAPLIEKISGDCETSPRETRGPFPNKTPTAYIRENIVGDREGVALLMTLTVLNKSEGCQPLANVHVDVWHCDNKGKYSEYGGYGIQPEDMTTKHFLRGRQLTDKNGRVSFISIFPGFYRGRAPHIHVEVLGNNEKSLLATQVAFPKGVCDTIYKTEYYMGTNYKQNSSDMVFRGSLEHNLADTIMGNTKEGYTLLKTIIVNI